MNLLWNWVDLWTSAMKVCLSCDSSKLSRFKIFFGLFPVVFYWYDLLYLHWKDFSHSFHMFHHYFQFEVSIVSYIIKYNTILFKTLYIINEFCWYFRFKITVWITGLVAFSTIFIEFIYIMNSLWNHKLYFLATFLWIGSILLMVVSAEVTIILTYINLCFGNYAWWWKSYLFGGSSSLFVLIYSIYYYIFNMHVTRFSPIVVYFGLMSLISSMVFLICGAVSSLSTFVFVKKIYSLIKID